MRAVLFIVLLFFSFGLGLEIGYENGRTSGIKEVAFALEHRGLLPAGFVKRFR
jgi:hypothetical protein